MLSYKSLIFYLFSIIPIVSSFSPDKSSFDAYGLKLAANDILLVESHPSGSSFSLRLSPFNDPLSCTIAYNDSNQYVYTVAVHSQTTSNDIIRFVFIGVNTQTNVPFIGSLIYTGMMGGTMKSSKKVAFSCDGWQTNNYRIHQIEQFVINDFFIVTVA
jgi:hypothetical protein